MIIVDLTSDVPFQLKCKTSDTFEFDGLNFYEDTAKTIPLDISSDTFRLHVLDRAGELLIEDFNFVVSGTGNNHLKITASAETMTLDPTTPGQPYSFFLEWTQDSTGKVTTIGTGPFIIEQKDKNG